MIGSYDHELAERLETNAGYVQDYLEDADGPHKHQVLANAVASLKKNQRETAELLRRVQREIETVEEADQRG